MKLPDRALALSPTGRTLAGIILAFAAGQASASLVDAAPECLRALAPQSRAWWSPEPQALALRIDDDGREITCRVSARAREPAGALLLYRVILDAASLRPLSVRIREDSGEWADVRAP